MSEEYRHVLVCIRMALLHLTGASHFDAAGEELAKIQRQIGNSHFDDFELSNIVALLSMTKGLNELLMGHWRVATIDLDTAAIGGTSTMFTAGPPMLTPLAHLCRVYALMHLHDFEPTDEDALHLMHCQVILMFVSQDLRGLIRHASGQDLAIIEVALVHVMMLGAQLSNHLGDEVQRQTKVARAKTLPGFTRPGMELAAAFCEWLALGLNDPATRVPPAPANPWPSFFQQIVRMLAIHNVSSTTPPK